MAGNPLRKHRGDEVLVDIRMKRLYNTIEPSVISNKLLTHAVYEQGPKDEAGKIAKSEGIIFSSVQSMRLDFKNILHINNLWAFKSLTKLQLVHNIIEKIENLDTLVHLEWLDLSFNKIEIIEGLDNLVKLTDLSLYCNRIKVIENLDYLKELNVFSIGQNLLTSIDNVLYLRKFKHLQSLNLAGNPICNIKEYFSFIFAFFPNLLFLDYKLITKEEHQVSYEKYLIRVEQYKEKEAEVEKEEEHEKQILEARKIHRLAFVEYLDTDVLFLQMINEDPEKDKLFCISGFEDLVDLYKEKFMAACNELFQKGMSELEKRQRDGELFYKCINASKNENNQKASDTLTEFNIQKSDLVQDINRSNTINENDMINLKQMTYELWNNLMTLEVQLLDQLEDTIRDYLRNLTEMVEGFLEVVHSYFAQIRELETAFTERTNESAMAVYEKLVKGDIEDDRLTIFKRNFPDKELLSNCISTSHDHRLLKIDNWEDEIKNKMHSWLKESCDHVKKKEEHERNRNRITEINNYVDHVRSEIENFEIPGVNIS